MHVPEHAASQQTPSAQNPLVHPPGALHGSPLVSFGPQTPPAQNAPVMQSPSLAQVVRHAPVEHW
jgi:hypothetical protein